MCQTLNTRTLFTMSALQVAARLPPAVQVLNSALQHSSRAGRSAIVQIALAGGEGSVPAASLDALGAAAHQLVDDMEDQQVIVCYLGLCRLCRMLPEMLESNLT